MIIRPVKECDSVSIERINNTAKQKFFGNITEAPISGKEIINSLTIFDHLLVIEDENVHRVCAIALLSVDSKFYLRRMARLRIAVDADMQTQGLGRMLLKASLDFAINELMMERVEAEFPVNYIGALKLFKSCGFKVEGIAKDWLYTSDGQYLDSYLMAYCRDVK